MTKKKKTAGRPSIYTKELALEICNRLSNRELLIDICKDDKMPHESTVYQWVNEDREGFSEMYARARACQAHALFEETLKIADDTDYDGGDEVDPESGRTLWNLDHINRMRLRIDTRKFYISKVLPKIYHDRVMVEQFKKDNGIDDDRPKEFKLTINGAELSAPGTVSEDS